MHLTKNFKIDFIFVFLKTRIYIKLFLIQISITTDNVSI